MEEERILKVNLKKAKEWFKSDNSFKKEIALQLFTKEELIETGLPNSLNEYINTLSPDEYEDFDEDLTRLNIFPNLKAMYILQTLRDCYRQRWKPDWNDNSSKYCIQIYANRVDIISFFHTLRFLSFQSPEIRDKFLKNFKDLIEEAGDLI